jgi:hypothetical protein
MTTSTLTANITPTPPITVDQLYTPASTPGNVGLCLSGGGTRACCAGMGQLRAFAALEANGRSLLSQFKAISTVSGGSWLGVPYQYMPASGPSDDDYLGAYDSDQGDLTLAELATLPAGNAGNPMTSVMFSLEGMAGTAVLLYEIFQQTSPNDPLPANMLPGVDHAAQGGRHEAPTVDQDQRPVGAEAPEVDAGRAVGAVVGAGSDGRDGGRQAADDFFHRDRCRGVELLRADAGDRAVGGRAQAANA